MAAFIQNLDPTSLIMVEASLAAFNAVWNAPPYNLPVFLFGIYAQESQESNNPLRFFTGLLGASVIFDIIWFAKNGQNVFSRLLSIAILLFKVPTFLTVLNALRQRGEQFGGLSIRPGDMSGATVWSMPGGFSSSGGGGGRDGYQNLDTAYDVPAAAPPPPKRNIPTTPLAATNGAAPPPPGPIGGGYQAQ